MKKVVSVVLALVVIVAMTACGSKEDVNKAEGNKDGQVAYKYYEMMDGDNPQYYFEANMEDQFLDEEASPDEEVPEPTKGIMAEARDGKDKFVLKTEAEPEEDMKMIYVKTDKLEMDGTTYQYDEYQSSYELPSDLDEEVMDTYLYIKRFLVDDQGELKALIYRQEMQGKDGKENQPIYQRIERITKLESKAPKDLFQIPKDYKEVEELDDEAA